MGSENQSCIIILGALETVSIERPLKKCRKRQIIYSNPEVCIAGISKTIKKSIGNVKDIKKKHFGVP